MGHKKVHSQGNIPFSWEDKPGVSKALSTCSQDCPPELGHHALNLTSSRPLASPAAPACCDPAGNPKALAYDKKIPLPPCPSQALRKSRSRKVLKPWQEDPFLAAYKECTKNISSHESITLSSQSKKSGIVSKARKSKLMVFSCKNSCEVNDSNSVTKESKLPPLPQRRIRRFSL